MQYIAESKNVKISPRKVRLVVDAVKKFEIQKAIVYLQAISNRASDPIKKTMESAIANAVNNFKVEKENLIIKEIQVGEGITYKRFHYAARGRTRPYKKRSSHIRVVLEEKKTEIKDMKTKEIGKKEEGKEEKV